MFIESVHVNALWVCFVKTMNSEEIPDYRIIVDDWTSFVAFVVFWFLSQLRFSSLTLATLRKLLLISRVHFIDWLTQSFCLASIFAKSWLEWRFTPATAATAWVVWSPAKLQWQSRSMPSPSRVTLCCDSHESSASRVTSLQSLFLFVSVLTSWSKSLVLRSSLQGSGLWRVFYFFT